MYAAQYLTKAIDQKVRELKEENVLAAMEDAHLLPAGSPDLCEAGHGFDLGLIIACIVSLVLYACLSFFVHGKKTGPYAVAMTKTIAHQWNEFLFTAGIKHRSRKYLNQKENEEIDDDEETLLQVACP